MGDGVWYGVGVSALLTADGSPVWPPKSGCPKKACDSIAKQAVGSGRMVSYMLEASAYHHDWEVFQALDFASKGEAQRRLI